MQLPHYRSPSSKFSMHLSTNSMLKTNMILSSSLLLLLIFSTKVYMEQESAFFNSTSLITIPNMVWDFNTTKEITFWTCSNSGSLISLNGSLISSSSPLSTATPSSDWQQLSVRLHNSSVLFSWNIRGQNGSVQIGNSISNNKWYTAMLTFSLNSVQFQVLQGSNIIGIVVVANQTYNRDLLHIRLSGTMKIGEGISGCLYQGLGVNFTSVGYVPTNITWDVCSNTTNHGCSKDQDANDCDTLPCQHGATCIDGVNNYTCVCPHNFNGTNCENDLAAMYGCAIQPCMNQGTCLPGENPRTFQCACAPGFSGQNCTDDIDECHLNGSICGGYPCYNRPGGFSCLCPPGYDGTSCKEVNECTSSPCQHGGSCSDGVNTFTCSCVPGYSGHMCEDDINECQSNPCTLPNMTCVDRVNDYECACIEGFSGSPCRDTDECALRVCRNNATCDNSQGSYTCHCPVGFTDKNCSSSVHYCQPNPCHNNATCSASVNGYNCSCLLGFNGTHCENNIDECKAHQCQNQASCEDQVNGYKCVCQPGWTGTYCQLDFDECESSPCLNRAQCHNYQNYYNCTCLPGFTGHDCSQNIDECAGIQCQNGGTCLDGPNDYNCNCTFEWMGRYCTERYNACSSQPCLNGASCATEPPQHNYTCTCLPGFTGLNCKDNINDCVDHKCMDYQECYDGINNYTCGCPRGYSGDRCQNETDECLNNPCQNGGNCTRGHGNYTCSCNTIYVDMTALLGPRGMFLSGYNGTNCESDINECDYTDPPICQGGGKCENTPGGFTCFCRNVPGQLGLGTLCEKTVSYCDILEPSKACQHGGTCVNQFSGSRCNCAPGFTDSYCQTDIDDCQPQPCQFGGTCSDRVNGYVCTCIDGINGTNCEHNIDDCSPNPCLHGGTCQDFINNPRFTCNCSNTGFNGTTCEINIDDCVNSQCLNGGTCVDGIKNYTCSCLPGYTDSRCEVDIKDCTPNPCAYDSQCLEYSNSSLYDKGDPHFVNFTHEKAAGYLCICVTGLQGKNCTEDIDECLSETCQHNSTCVNIYKDGFKCNCSRGYEGTHCETEINECTRYTPCKNGGKCTDRIADYDCACQAPVASIMNFGGKNCTTFLRGCQGPRRCWNGNCIPKLINETQDLHSFDCDCYPGYTGQYCGQSTDISFRRHFGDHIRSQINSSEFDLSLRFQTTVSSGVLVFWKKSDYAFVLVELNNGKVTLRYREDIPATRSLNVLVPVNNSAYHQLHLVVSQNITLSLPQDNCSGEGYGTQACRTIIPLSGSRPSVISQMFIGSGSFANITDPTIPSSFVGCMEDIMINGQLFYPGRQTGQYFVSPGCPRVVQCARDSCNGHGLCEDLWDSHVCHCSRPYYGNTCENEYESATYGIYPGTFARYRVFGNADNWTLSFFIITKQQDGFILYIGNDDPDYRGKRSFIGLYISGGNMSGDFFKCGYVKHFNTARQVSDGQKHFIAVEVKDTSFKVMVDSVPMTETVPASYTVCSTNYGFVASVVKIGQGDIPNSRRKRDVHFLETNDFFQFPEISFTRWKRQAVTGQTLVASYQNMSGFQGVIQDAQVNNGASIFYLSYNNTALTTPETSNVTIGEHSTQAVCQSSLCENGGNCTEVFYNDFKCACLRGFMGKNCSMLDYCAYATCPSESTCQNLAQGYECNSTASFSTDNSFVTYKLSGNISKPVLTFQFRTRGLFGLIFLLRKGDYFFKVRVANGRLEMNRKLSSDFSRTSTTRFGSRVDDGRWYGGKFEVINGTKIKLQVFQDAVLLDETEFVDLVAGNFSFEEMLRSGEIILGSTGRQKFSAQWEAGFNGCLREVRMGGLLLPFFPDETFKNNTARDRFLAQQVQGIVNNCDGTNSCVGHSCLNGGSCVDLWNDYKCDCPAGLEGELCEDNPDNCASGPCLNGGVCVDGLATFTCTCPKGFSGSICEIELDPCAANSTPLCANNSPCVKYGSDYKCNCSDLEWTGWYCNVSVYQNCSVAGSLCQNNGTCNNTSITVGTITNVSSFNCSCIPGYEGPLCEKAIDYCSINGPVCANNGTCVNNLKNRTPECNCSTSLGFTGLNCSEKINNCDGMNCNNGTCKSGVSDFTCLCNTGYTGRRCDQPLDVCQNRSLCQHGDCNQGFCNCTESGWEGAHCVDDIEECNSTVPVCLHDGNCTNLEGSFHCDCTVGFQGARCETPNCTDICMNGGLCATNTTHWSCSCPEFVEGPLCDFIGPCFLQPCQKDNTKTCSQSKQFNNYTCSCNTGWKGQNCTDDVNECEDKTDGCLNGTCSNTNGNYTCVCQAGFTGRFCEGNIDECLPQPCENNGVCVDGIGNYTCRCDNTGYEGPNCSINIDECAVNGSLCNRGVCKDLPGSYECNCTSQFLGMHCELDNPCYNSTVCQNAGKCQSLNQNGSYIPSCLCSSGYEGATCEKSARSNKSPDLGVIIGPIVGGVVLVILIIVIIAFVMTARSKRATRGAYSPSQQETSGSRVELDNVLKKPPEERLI